MRSIPAVRAGNNIAAGAGRSAWTSMAQGAAIGQSGAERPIGVEIPNAVAFIRSLPLQSRELALKELATTADARQLAVDHCARYGKVVKFLAVQPYDGGYISFACRWVPYGANARPLRSLY